ncbi:Indoleamine 2,3-dioxygenase 2 [Sciurus carolinensis]|uniref:Indoleamine 2,3-dioxygenase 2 n=1 Tax=Sciurus carolinensis TaxID=30640 RepID=A0AA41NAI7_SCICA|nr:Indoleamine 2,3-dioxygenase 2 [Sciurus carolinensis]
MEIAKKLPHLIESHQLRAHVNKMPLLNCQFLKGYREQRLAHLVLSSITMGYVWQEGETQPIECDNEYLQHSVLPSNHVTIFFPSNLDTIILFPGGESLRGFILVTVLVEKAAVPGIKALVQAMHAVLQPSQDALLKALQQLKLCIQDITRTLGQMHDYVDPDIFYAVIRIFLSGWKDNPAMPRGLIYEGISKEPLKYSGGSAAQSSVLHAFDEFLGIRHSKESADFLYRMRDYMPPSHKAFIEEIHAAPSLRDFILSSGHGHCLTAYNQCLEALAELRSYHITMVTRYLITAAARARSRRLNHLPGPPQALEDRGTGGTAALSFLKNVRDKTLEATLHPRG